MKLLKDLTSSDSRDENLDIRDSKSHKESTVVKNNDTLCVDLQKNIDSTIELSKSRDIEIESKKTRNFDALEKNIGFLQRKKNIVLTSKKEWPKIYPYFLYLKRKLRDTSFWWRIGFVMVIFFFIILVWLLDKVFIENRVNAGYKKLIDIREGNIWAHEIHKKINNARFDFILANAAFTPFRIFSTQKIRSVHHVIAGGKYLSRSLDEIFSLYNTSEEYIGEKNISKIYFTELLEAIRPNLANIESSLNASLSHYKAISWLPNSGLEETRQGNIKKIEKILWYISWLNTNYDAMKNLLGHERRKSYLIVFQNADEIRPTGGFMGSMGLLELYRGRVQLFQKKDVYAIEWDLKTADYERLAAPKWINTLTEKFWLRDANYYANLKDSSEAIQFFTRKAGLTIDWIIYLNQTSIERLLEITWPIYFPLLETDITAQNFSELISLSVEAKTFKTGTLWTPKQVLFDFISLLQEKVFSEAKYFDYLQLLVHDVQNKEVMMWSFHPWENEFLSALELNGKRNYDETLDYSFPVFTSISGNKSDRYMQRKFIQKVTSWEACSYDVSFTMENTHMMTKNIRDDIQKRIVEYGLEWSPNLFEIQWAGTNKQYVRVIFPHNASIVPQTDLEVVDYGSRKWAEFFLETELSQTTKYKVEYRLENPECKPYSYKFYKQAGLRNYDIEISIDDENYEYDNFDTDFYFEVRK